MTTPHRPTEPATTHTSDVLSASLENVMSAHVDLSRHSLLEIHDAYRESMRADAAYSADLRRIYGEQAGEMRYRLEGVITPELRALWRASRDAFNVWSALSARVR